MIIINIFLDLIEFIFKLVSHLIKPVLNCFGYIITVTGIFIVLFFGFSNAADCNSVGSMIFTLILVSGIRILAPCALIYVSSIAMFFINYILDAISFIFDRFSSFIGRLNDKIIEHAHQSDSSSSRFVLLSKIQDFNYYFTKNIYLYGIIGIPFIFYSINSLAIKYMDYNPHFPSSLDDYISVVNRIDYNRNSVLGVILGFAASLLFTLFVHVFPSLIYMYCLYSTSKSLSRYFKVKRLFFKYGILGERLNNDDFDSFLYYVFYNMDININGKKIRFCPDIDSGYSTAEDMYNNSVNNDNHKSKHREYYKADSNYTKTEESSSKQTYSSSKQYSNQYNNGYSYNQQHNSANTGNENQHNTHGATNNHENIMLQKALQTFDITLDSLMSISYHDLKSKRAELIKKAHPDNGGTHHDAVNINVYYNELKKLKDAYNAA